MKDLGVWLSWIFATVSVAFGSWTIKTVLLALEYTSPYDPILVGWILGAALVMATLAVASAILAAVFAILSK
jgi:hypothetical protein